MWDGHDGMGWWMVFGSIWFVLLWGLIIWALFAVASRFGGDRGERSSQRESPLEIAKRRYASGEITREQFEQLRKDIQ